MLTLFNDETIYSALSRLYTSLNLHNPAELNLIVFGKRKKRVHFYLPSNLNKIGNFLHLDAKTLLTHNSLFCLYKLFLPKKQSVELEYLMLNDSCRVPTNIIEASSSLHSAYQLKYCPICVEHDIEVTGTSYWHVIHQVPLMHICPFHYTALHTIEGGDKGLANKYILPNIITSSRSTCITELQKSFANLAIEFTSKAQKEALNLETTYLKLLQAHRLLRGNNLSLKRIEGMYWKAMEVDNNKCFQKALTLHQIFRLLRAPQQPIHPIKHLIALAFMNVGATPQPTLQKIDKRKQSSQTLEKSPQLLKKIQDMYKSHQSFNYVAKRLKLSRNKVKSALKSLRLVPLSKLERKVLLKAMMGLHRRDIANQLSITTGYVEQIISYDSSIVAYRKDIKQKYRQKKYSKRIIDYVKSNPHKSIKDIKKDLMKEYYWLYKHAKTWLKLNIYLPMPINTPKKVNRPDHL